jgi:predicted extracellular nuclease
MLSPKKAIKDKAMPKFRLSINKLPYFIISIIILFSFIGGCQTQTVMPSPTITPLAQDVLPEPTLAEPTATTPPETDTISKIQGASHISPLRSLLVSDVTGVVTVVKSDGFYMQSITPDDDPDTSEGLFVFTEWIPSARVGDEVAVSGRVDEFVPGGGYGNLSQTRIKDPEVEILSRGNELPQPTIIGENGRIPPTEIIDDDTNGYISGKGEFDPENDGIDFYESLESMLVQVNNAVVVGPTNAYKEIVVLPDGGKNVGLRTPRGGIVIQVDDFNPERIILDDLLVETPFVQVGDYAEEPIIGVMDFDFGNFKFLITERVNFVSGNLAPENPLTAPDEDLLRIVSYNVLNLSAVETRRIAILADQIVNQMASPDIIGLQEIQDNDGTGFSTAEADLTYQGIIDGILELGGPRYGYIDIAPIPEADGGAPAGNIRTGFLYRLDRGLTLASAPYGDAKTAVEIQDISGRPTLSLNPGRIDPTNPAFYDSRKPLVVTFLYKGEPLFIINTHFVSKGPDRDLFGEFQPPLLDSEVPRLEQAQIVHDFVAEILSIDPEARVVVLGDMNDFYFSPPIDLLEGEILNNLIETLPPEERYSYIYDGNSQTLDQILASVGMMRGLVFMDVLHINSEFDYNTRFSDHDPLIATFSLP